MASANDSCPRCSRSTIINSHRSDSRIEFAQQSLKLATLRYFTKAGTLVCAADVQTAGMLRRSLVDLGPDVRDLRR